METDRLLEASPTWKRWKRRFAWEARVAAHDADVADRDRETRIRQLAAMNERHAAIATSFQAQIVQRLAAFVERGDAARLTPTQMIYWLEKATLVERRARGASTDLVRHERPSDTALLDFSKLSNDELELFETLAMKAGVHVG